MSQLIEPRTISLASINKAGRVREDYGEMQPLLDSISEIGVIQPLVLNEEPDGTFTLAAGGRRTKALELLGFTEVYEGVTCDPKRPGFVFRKNMTEDEILEVELEENLQRKGFSWAEEVLMISKVHAAKQKNANLAGKNWGQRQTGQLLGVSLGQVNNVLTVAKALRANDTGILKATSLTDAIKVLMERQENEAQKILAQRAGVSVEASATAPIHNHLTIELPSDSPARLTTEQPAQTHGQNFTPPDRLSIKLSNHLFLGDSVDDLLPRWPEGRIDHIVTDIPYGIDMDNLQTIRDIKRVENQHDVAQNVGLMPRFLKQAFRVLKDGGFCVFFYDLDHHEKLQQWAIEEGFKVQRWPLVWIKTHRCKNEAAAFNYTKATEYAMVLRKGNATLVKPQGVNYVLADGSVERKLYDNPFAKPFAVWKFIFDAIAIPGQRVLDPFAGEMSSIRAAILHGLTPYAIELENTHFNRGIDHVKEAYRLLTSGNVEFN